jgi:hypothetical protein
VISSGKRAVFIADDPRFVNPHSETDLNVTSTLRRAATERSARNSSTVRTRTTVLRPQIVSFGDHTL